MLNRSICNIYLIQKHKLPVKNLKRRFYDALKILKNITLIKSNEAKMIELNTENTKMMLLENLKE